MKKLFLTVIFFSHVIIKTNEPSSILHIPSFNKLYQLETKRCFLRPAQTKDIDDLIDVMSNDDVLRYYLFHRRISSAKFKNDLHYWPNKMRILLFLKIINMKHYAHVWKIEDKTSHQTIGFVGLHKIFKNVNENLRAAHKNNYNLTLVLKRNWQGQKLSTELFSQFIPAVFTHKKFKKCTGLTLLTNIDNIHAQKVIKNPKTQSLKYGLVDQGYFHYRYSSLFYMNAYTISRQQILEQINSTESAHDKERT
ncbi:MAG: GNAT family N-acetyltransferase [Candidatus Dependentiae bacterium]